ncbi:MAG TPA: prolipoprotein diacylglyceryl transferase [Cytophagales bacterium]|nr:prolipoprotein diacylglyceryl transferase [Cytophagales bacterium]HAA22052.1 prolipoprotein diacylglyceryl transferase [Cytophagales bacterium]HAP58577.1 prolipoprotein diacylglyceryl transferase [Cytophagales bacterium]
MSEPQTTPGNQRVPWYEKLQKRWGLTSVGQVVVVLVVFALTGTTIARLNRPLGEWMGIGQEAPRWLRWGFSIVIILPLYQVVLLVYGFIFGQFRFFWEFEKKMVRRMAFWRSRKKSEPIDAE